MKREIVAALEQACALFHRWPFYHLPVLRTHRLAELSDWLDQRWSTGEWKHPSEL